MARLGPIDWAVVRHRSADSERGHYEARSRMLPSDLGAPQLTARCPIPRARTRRIVVTSGFQNQPTQPGKQKWLRAGRHDSPLSVDVSICQDLGGIAPVHQVQGDGRELDITGETRWRAPVRSGSAPACRLCAACDWFPSCNRQIARWRNAHGQVNRAENTARSRSDAARPPGTDARTNATIRLCAGATKDRNSPG